MLLPLQGVNTMAIRNTQGVASLALGAFGLSARALSAAPQLFSPRRCHWVM